MQDLAAAQHGDERAFRALVAPHQRELRAFCYQMSGAIADADDLMQEVLIRAWRGLPGFEARSSLRTWLYRVATSVCLDALKSRAARKRAEDQGPPADPGDAVPDGDPDEWIGPCPPAVYAGAAPSPEARYALRESVGFAFLAALQLLPPKQRATLIACDVLGLSAEECAGVLETTGGSVESALRRARETIAARAPSWRPSPPDDATTRGVLARYVQAWERADAEALVALLHDEASMSMPPMPVWLCGPRAIAGSIDAMVFAGAAPGDFRAVPAEANGLPALGLYRRAPDGAFAPYALHVLALDGERIRALTAFVDPRLFASFELAPRLPANSSG